MTDQTTPEHPPRAVPRPGGRSARVQAAVHQAVRELQHGADRDSLTVPAIASRAGVTPSTIYRRWGDLGQLLADVALEQLHVDGPPADTGSLATDVYQWLEQFAEEMSSAPGRAMLRDVVSVQGHAGAARCQWLCSQHIDLIRERAIARGEQPLETDRIVDQVVAPLFYRLLFTGQTPSADDLKQWTASVL